MMRGSGGPGLVEIDVPQGPSGKGRAPSPSSHGRPSEGDLDAALSEMMGGGRGGPGGPGGLMVEVDGPDGPGLMEIDMAQGPPGKRQAPSPRRGGRPSEGDLDQILSQMMGSGDGPGVPGGGGPALVEVDGPDGTQMMEIDMPQDPRQGRPPSPSSQSGRPSEGELDKVLSEMMGPGSPSKSDSPHLGPRGAELLGEPTDEANRQGGIPASALRQLFPQGQMIIEEDDDGS